MNFELSEEHLLIQKAARDFAQNELKSGVVDRDSNSAYPYQGVKRMSELGFLGMTVSEKYGGGGMDTISYLLAVEEISKIDNSCSVILSAHNSLACWGIEEYGTENQKNKYLRPLASGDKIGAFCLSEPESGSDATQQKTIAKKKGDYYLINGTKNWITNGEKASLYVVIAQTNPEKGYKGINAFIVDADSKGLTTGIKEDKLGIRSSDTVSVMFQDVLVPKENRLGPEGFGFKYAMKTLEGGRIGIASQALGICEGAYELSLEYSKLRKTFGKSISQHQAISFKLADMATDIEAARLLIYKSAYEKDNNKPYGLSSSMAKLFSSEIAMKHTVEAVQIHGGYGFVKEYHVERLMRDAKITQIYEGTSEIQKIIIARSLLK